MCQSSTCGRVLARARVTDAEFEPSEVTFLRLIPRTVTLQDSRSTTTRHSASCQSLQQSSCDPVHRLHPVLTASATDSDYSWGASWPRQSDWVLLEPCMDRAWVWSESGPDWGSEEAMSHVTWRFQVASLTLAELHVRVLTSFIKLIKLLQNLMKI